MQCPCWGKFTHQPLCVCPGNTCATFRPFDSSGAGKGSIEAFRSGSSIHSLALTTAITHSTCRRGGSYIYIYTSHPQSGDISLSPRQLLQEKVSIFHHSQKLWGFLQELFYRYWRLVRVATQRGEDSNLSLMSLGFSVITLNYGWYKEQHIIVMMMILIASSMFYSSSKINLSNLFRATILFLFLFRTK